MFSVVVLLGFRFRAMFPTMSRPSHELWMMQSWKGKFSKRKQAVSSCKTLLKFETRSSSTCAEEKTPCDVLAALVWDRQVQFYGIFNLASLPRP